MFRLLLRWLALALPLATTGAGGSPWLEAITVRDIVLKTSPVNAEPFALSKRLRFVAGWRLRSDDPEFGGLSALAAGPEGMVALTDRGALYRFRPGSDLRHARLMPLPSRCAHDRFRLDRDSESLARDPASGDYWIGFEWRNAICRASPDLSRALHVAKPAQMANWPRTGGPEAMTRLADGRIAVLAERGRPGEGSSPILVFPDDPARTGSRAVALRYRPPAGYSPVDIAELPGGELLVLHRRFQMPLDFSTLLTLLPADALASKVVESGRPLALLKSPGLNDNFEGLAVELEGGRTYIWLISDDNFVPSQKTYLLKFEMSGGGSGVR